MKSVVIVNASSVLADREIKAMIPALQKQVDRDFLPLWGDQAVPATLSFAPISDIGTLPEDIWPIFVNKHSTDASALGWHTNEDRVFGRIFAGDCIKFGISWTVDLSHELLEMLGDPDATKTFKMRDGRLAAYEACDAVEADDLSYTVDNFLVSDFVTPAYFSNGDPSGRYDYAHHLKGPCPALTPGGYMSICEPGAGWSQIQMSKRDGFAGRRALLRGFRRTIRHAQPLTA